MTHIAGVDGCKAGWIAVTFPMAEPRLAEARVFATFADIVAALPTDSVIAVDMPIGLPDRTIRGGRQPDWAARAFLGPCRSRVFPVPSRAAVDVPDYTEACKVARDTSDEGRAFSKQAYGIFRKIREIDSLLRWTPALGSRVFEVHPEVSFAMMNNGLPVFEPKKKKGRVHEPGMQVRIKLLENQKFPVERLVETWKAQLPRGVGLDDLLDACACAWSAGRIARGEARVLPPEPGVDSYGLEMAIRA
jgi:predicted RNase H-like nuclease